MTSRSGRALALLAALAALVVYTLTAAHTVTWLHNGADSGDLVAAAFTFGVPHPPGYPLYTLIAALFAHVPGLEPGHAVALLSGISAAAAVAVLARAGSALLSSSADSPLPFVTTLLASMAALGFGLTPLLWSQAVIPEVYALNLLFVAILLWACASRSPSPDSPRRVVIAALALGLGMAHHPAILLLAPGAVVALWPGRRDRRALIYLFAPLLLYLYLPIAALGNPPVNWGDPIRPEGFFWLVTAAQYRPYLFALDPAGIFNHLAFASASLLEQFTAVGVALGLWGLVQLAFDRRRVALATGLMFVLTAADAILYATRDSFLYLLPAMAVFLLWAMYGAGHILTSFGRNRLVPVVMLALVALWPVYNLLTWYPTMDVSRDRAALDYARAQLDPLPDDAVLFADGDEPLFALWYYRHAIAYRDARSVIVSQGLLQYAWYYDNLRRTMSEVQFKPADAVTDAHARAAELIRVTFAEGRAVCFTASSPLLPDFEYQPQGPVQCVLAERPSP